MFFLVFLNFEKGAKNHEAQARESPRRAGTRRDDGSGKLRLRFMNFLVRRSLFGAFAEFFLVFCVKLQEIFGFAPRGRKKKISRGERKT